ncbi:hypothetical protein LA080_005496 [Diaporthe eres]|nr:hypothetical protein LA080_005496 [Diaporthe eres]
MSQPPLAQPTFAAHVMTIEKPPAAQRVSHWTSCSEAVPSSWHCQLVRGARSMGCLSAGPRFKVSGLKSAWAVI